MYESIDQKVIGSIIMTYRSKFLIIEVMGGYARRLG